MNESNVQTRQKQNRNLQMVTNTLGSEKNNDLELSLSKLLESTGFKNKQMVSCFKMISRAASFIYFF